MSTDSNLGARLRMVRRQQGLNQKELAEQIGISPSYLNLIENGKRPLSASVLIRLAQALSIDLASFGASDRELEAHLGEVFGDPLFDEAGLTAADVRAFAVSSPAVGEAVMRLYRSWLEARHRFDELSARVSGQVGPGTELATQPGEEVNDFLQRHGNHFPDLEEAAQRLRRDARAHDDDRYQRLASWLETVHGVRVQWLAVEAAGDLLRRYDPERRILYLSQVLAPRSRHFQLAHQIALLQFPDLLDDLSEDPRLSGEDARRLVRITLASYFAGAVLMPYADVLEEAERSRYDIERLGQRFRTSFEQVCHRLCTLRRPGAQGVPFHMMRVDIAGNISKRFSGSGIRFARFSGACPRWNVHSAFLTPGQIRTQVSVMEDHSVYFCIARTVQKSGGWHQPQALHAIGLGCDLRHARRLVYADGVEVGDTSHAVPVGVTCRLCERTGCLQRAFPLSARRLEIDENSRRVNFYGGGSQE